MPAIAYDPSRTALFHPDARGVPALPPDAGPDAIAAAFAILAYYRFELARAPEREAQAIAKRLGYAISGWFDDRTPPRFRRVYDAQGIGAVNAAGDALVAFRGTQPDSFADLLTDINAFPHTAPAPARGRVHQGFWGALAVVRDQVETWLAATPHRRLLITGHSLGAAMATLLAAYHPTATLVTFGSPLVGDQSFADAFAGRPVRRYVDCCDLVATVPPPLLGYRHLDGLRYIDRNGAIHSAAIDHAADQAKAGRDYPLRLRLDWDNIPFRRLADHAPINYLSAILGVRTGP